MAEGRVPIVRTNETAQTITSGMEKMPNTGKKVTINLQANKQTEEQASISRRIEEREREKEREREREEQGGREKRENRKRAAHTLIHSLNHSLSVTLSYTHNTQLHPLLRVQTHETTEATPVTAETGTAQGHRCS